LGCGSHFSVPGSQLRYWEPDYPNTIVFGSHNRSGRDAHASDVDLERGARTVYITVRYTLAKIRGSVSLSNFTEYRIRQLIAARQSFSFFRMFISWYMNPEGGSSSIILGETRGIFLGLVDTYRGNAHWTHVSYFSITISFVFFYQIYESLSLLPQFELASFSIMLDIPSLVIVSVYSSTRLKSARGTRARRISGTLCACRKCIGVILK